MGLFDMFTKEGRLRKHARTLSDRNTLPEDREAAEAWLMDEGSGQALYALLKRFDVRVSQQIVDTQEKERLYDSLLALGPELDDPLRQFVKAANNRTWPLKLLEARQGTDVAIGMVFDLLQAEKGAASFEPERKKHLLVWIADHRWDGVVEQVAPFLEDFDEDVRFAAAEAVLAQEGAQGRDCLAAVLARPDEESGRLKHRIAEAFSKRGWTLPDPEAVDGILPAGFALRDDGRIVAA